MVSEPLCGYTTIYASNEDPSLVGKHLEEDLGATATWINSNGLKVNVAKTHVQLMVLCGKSKQKSAQLSMWSVQISDKELPKQESVKYLGVRIDKWKFTYWFVLPHLDYCSIIWHTCGVTLTNRIEWVQNYALRMILQKKQCWVADKAEHDNTGTQTQKQHDLPGTQVSVESDSFLLVIKSQYRF